MKAFDGSQPRAIAVWFKDLKRWDYGFFRTVTWQWPSALLFPLATVLSRKHIEIPNSEPRKSLPIIEKITFGGQVRVTAVDQRASYKGRLFWADPGDLIYSKIRVKQGSLALVPREIDRLAVSAEYPVYQIDQKHIDPLYLTLVLTSKTFLSLFEGLSHGGSTKTRIPPVEFERQMIPIPPLSDQRAIISQWQTAQTEIAAAQERINKQKAQIEEQLFASLGLKLSERLSAPRAFAVWWKNLDRWGTSFNYLHQQEDDLTRGFYPVTTLGELLDLVQYGTSTKASLVPEGVPVIRMNNIVDGQLQLANLKYARLTNAEEKRLLLKDGDILFNRTNSKELVGKCAVFHEKDNFVFASYLIRIRVDPSKANADFLAWVINSPIGRQQISALSRQIIGQANINSEELRGLKIPLPPLPIQVKIMTDISEGLAEIARENEAVETRAKAVKAEIEASILGA